MRGVALTAIQDARAVSLRARRMMVRPVLLALALNAAAVVAFGVYLSTGGEQVAVPAARACGLGDTPTMLADKQPSLMFPTVKNMPQDAPIGIFTDNYVAGQPISFVEDMSRLKNAPAPTSFTWRWQFGDGSTSNEISPKHTYAAPGDYNVHSQIFDTTSQQWTDMDSAQIHVIAQALPNPPLAKATSSVYAVALGQPVAFDATGSHAQDGTKLTYLWNFNDGSTSTDAHPTHSFAIPGSGVVGLTVTDGHGARSTATVNVLVVQQLPQASLTASQKFVQVGATVSFDASASVAPTLPAGDALVKYGWDFGDGTPAVSTTAPAVSHTFLKAGRFVVTVQAIDAQGAPGTATAVVAVGALNATASGPDWFLIGAGVAALIGVVVGGYFAVQAHRKRAELIRRHEAALELARARSVRQGAHGGRQMAMTRRAEQPTRPVHNGRDAYPGGSHAQRAPGATGPRGRE
jgi:PKD repeat protein